MTDKARAPATRFSQEVFDTICERIANGESLRAILRDDDMPAWAAFFRWLQKDETGALIDQYTRARETSAEADADEVNAIGRGTLDGTYDPQAARVAIDALKWSAGKKKPKVYGDKVSLDHSGGLNVTVANKDADW